VRPSQVIGRASDYLARRGVEHPRPSAEALLAWVLGTDRSGLYTRERGLSSAEARTFGRALCRRCAGTPVQHLTGDVGFRGLRLTIREGVFIPRPETEVLVDEALGLVDVERPIVVDVGTGSGAIALSIKDERRDARVFAFDREPEAVALARENAERLGLDVVVRRGDLHDGVPDRLTGRIDVVVSNPPYIDPDALASLPAVVLADPASALLGGIEGYRELFGRAGGWLRPGGGLAVEVGEELAHQVRTEAERAGFRDVRIERDLTGRDRVVTGRAA
jgi:release factor glutamine methyltransferase